MDIKLVADKLRKLRGNIPREVVADSCDITVSALGNYENGIRVPRDEVKVRLAKFYGVSVESIFFTNKVHEM